MSLTNQKAEKLYQKHAWLILFILGILLALSGLFIVVAAGEDMSDFETSTGTAWEEFSAGQPEAADYLVRLQRLAGVSGAGFALFSVAITWIGYRPGEKWAWVVMWLFPATFGLYAIVFFIADATGLGIFYGATVVIAALGLLLPYRRFFPSELSEPEAA